MLEKLHQAHIPFQVELMNMNNAMCSPFHYSKNSICDMVSLSFVHNSMVCLTCLYRLIRQKNKLHEDIVLLSLSFCDFLCNLASLCNTS